MRIKLNILQLNKLSEGLPFPVMIERPGDVRGLLEILGKEMPWNNDESNKPGANYSKRPVRVAFSVEAADNDFICDIHPALVQYIYKKLSTST